MGRAPCCEKMGLKKGPWTPEEDQILINFIRLHGHPNWRALPKQAGLLRCGKSCRLRWTNYLRPDIKRGNFAPEEEETIIKLHQQLGNRWSAIAARLPGRTDNEIKNVWHTHLKKRLPQAGQSTPKPAPTKKRTRKPKAAKPKRGDDHVLEAPKTQHVDCRQFQISTCTNANDSDTPTHATVQGAITTATTTPTTTSTSLVSRSVSSPQPCTTSNSSTDVSISTLTSATSEVSYYDINGDDCLGDLLLMDNDEFWMDVLPCIQDTSISAQDYHQVLSESQPNSAASVFAQHCPVDYEPEPNSDSFFSEGCSVVSNFESKPNYLLSDLLTMEMEPQGLEFNSEACDQYDTEFFWYHLLAKSNELTELSHVL